MTTAETRFLMNERTCRLFFGVQVRRPGRSDPETGWVHEQPVGGATTTESVVVLGCRKTSETQRLGN
jgi:hypothetical protein